MVTGGLLLLSMPAFADIEMQLPEGFEPLVAPVPGWEIRVDGGIMTLSGGAIAPGHYQDFTFVDFTFVAANPEEGGEARIAAIQTYDDGEVAEWVGAEDAELPASFVTYGGAAAEGDAHHADGEAAAPATPRRPACPAEAPTGWGSQDS